MSDHPSEMRQPPVEAEQSVSQTRASGHLEDALEAVRMTRAVFLVSVVGHTLYIVNNYVAFGWPLASAMLPYGLVALCASLVAAAISFSPGYVRYWKYVTFGVCVCLMAAWTGAEMLAGRQVEMAFAVTLLLAGSALMCPWEPKWQAFLAIGAVISFGTNTALAHPLSPDIYYLWTYLLVTVGLTLASSRLSTQWREALQQSEAKLVGAREAALTASRAKSEFLSSMSHEIRTPMNAILGMADLLAETNLRDEQRRYVETMVNNGNALLDLINGILDLAKVESGRLHLEETDFDLADLVELVTETFAVRAHEKGLELLFRVLPEVPTKLVGDPLRLRQILINLIGNAIKFTDHGEVLLTVEKDTDVDGLVALRFSVRDTGIGIPADQIDNIFRTFTQADSSTTRKFGGTGLGLAIARRLAELMHGRIWVESEAGKGSTFRFTACFTLHENISPSLSAEPLDLEGVHVLIVDDNATNRLILRETLARRGAMIQEAARGKEALIEVERGRNVGKPYRLVLLDCRMPGMDGFEVAEELKREPVGAQPTVLMLTSDDMSHKLARIREVGIDAYVVKPVKRSELFKAIAQVLGRAKKVESRISAAPTAALVGGARALKILIAEDSPDNRILIEAYLKSMPYTLDVAENGAVALQKYLHNPYDLVLMDVQMPVMDGLTATRKIREWEQEHGRTSTPIVALTASALEENVRQSMEAGCTAHVNKPVKKTALLAAIHDLTEPAAEAHSNGRAQAEHAV